ncbi:hypothetical protein TPHA_0I02650 [Tetrapisispora phaffii CBS 4417]|uniref:Uncharacterized protein n=1 Tax=Tetrapisispora phaffii (strain ATCC 24235 / CBS 4417 / NBRC 1672 / NRRL Y-8282 / UCD 70-5) TaxID=1071381 RepID=G8BXY8_TETPH|nr:hypothetical protein TPHA_0I02650 [Tetrapisispora phaffii CBS 4417]CCE64766.1 hypothetical protein TPHA_0I02650 [Tetrapisispora phaffii CBS 4417]
MFDPLDLFTPEEERVNEVIVQSRYSSKESQVEIENDGDGLGDSIDDSDAKIVSILDLPLIPYANTKVLLCTLILLRPNAQINFNSDESVDSDIAKDVPTDLLDELLKWYTETFPNSNLNTLSKIIEKIPVIKSTSDKESLLNYYTSALKNLEKRLAIGAENDIEHIDLAMKEVVQRISENCGRTAQPSMTREFKLENLHHIVKLYEPSLTADNLGWKTWGSSLVLSQYLINNFNKYINVNNCHVRKVRVLELGAGTGLVGISWGCKWKEEVTSAGNENLQNMELFLTDLPEITNNLAKNVSTNELSDFCKVDVLNWTDPTSFTNTHTEEPFQYILIADPIYSPEHPKWVVDMIVKFLKKPKDGNVSRCFMQIPIREKYQVERETLWRLIEENNLKFTDEQVDYGQDDWGQVQYLYKEIQWK